LHKLAKAPQELIWSPGIRRQDGMTRG
jgi:hypothetical protein